MQGSEIIRCILNRKIVSNDSGTFLQDGEYFVGGSEAPTLWPIENEVIWKT